MERSDNAGEEERLWGWRSRESQGWMTLSRPVSHKETLRLSLMRDSINQSALDPSDRCRKSMGKSTMVE